MKGGWPEHEDDIVPQRAARGRRGRAGNVGPPVTQAPAPPAPPAPPRRHGRPSMAGRAVRSTVEWVVIIAAALAVAFVVRSFLFQPFFIPSASMEPELGIGDRIIVNKLSYRLHDIRRGDIVVFVRPPCEAGGTTKDLVKRVVGLEGETVQARDGRVEVDGRAIDEGYLPAGRTTGDFGPVTVPEDHIWVMGDNRGNSKDSRTLCKNRSTFIEEGDVVGRAFVRVWPPTHLGIL